MEHRVRLERQLVAGDMGRLQTNRRLDVGLRHLERLAGQRVHDVDVEVVEARRGRLGDTATYVVAAVDSPDGLQTVVVEGLCADRQPIDARGAVPGR